MVGWHNTEPHRQETVLWERSKDPKGSQGFFHILKKWLSHCRYLDVGIYFFAYTILQKWENAQKSQNTLWIITDNFFKCNANQSVTFWFRIFSIFLWYRYRFRKFLVSKKVSVSVSKKNWYQKKYRYRFRFFLVSEKVSVSVSKFFGIEKSIGIGFEKKLVLKKYESVSKQFG